MSALADTQPATTVGVEEAMALLREICQPLETERVGLEAARGRVLREPVRAPEDQPPFDRSAVDGFAVREDDPGPRFTVVEELRAGDWKPLALERGQAARIATGAALPCEGLRVVMKENARLEGDRLEVFERDPERHIRFRGEDARRGTVLVEAGTCLQPGALALLASAGATQPLVTRLPRAVHLATGSEIVAPRQTPGRGQIRDSNSTLVRAFLESWSVAIRQSRAAEDEATALTTLRGLLDATETVDLVLVSGGASVGEHDFTRRLFERLGFAVRVSRTNTRPGRPLIVAQRGYTLALGLPGNPLGHFVCLNLYARTALEAWSGRPVKSPFVEGLLAADLEGGANARETFWPARSRIEGGRLHFAPLGWRSSGDLTALAAADALLRLKPGVSRLTRGSPVEALLTATAP